MINIKDHPDIIVLKKPDEELEEFLKVSSEDLLLRWFNYHLEAAKHEKRVKKLVRRCKRCRKLCCLITLAKCIKMR